MKELAKAYFAAFAVGLLIALIQWVIYEEERTQRRVEQEVQQGEAERVNKAVSEGVDEVLEAAEE